MPVFFNTRETNFVKQTTVTTACHLNIQTVMNVIASQFISVVAKRVSVHTKTILRRKERVKKN
jgi:hypothetical protein